MLRIPLDQPFHDRIPYSCHTETMIPLLIYFWHQYIIF